MIINAIPNKTIVIGRQGENLVRTVRFPIECYSVFGEGEFSLVHRRPTDDAAYPCVTTKDENYLYWNITNADVQYSGNGSLQLTYTVGDHIAKSDVYITNTLKSLSQTDNPPEAWKAWVDEVLEAAERAEEASTHGPSIDADSKHWMIWNGTVYEDSGVLAEGKDGSDAEVTAANIAAALGYTPADDADLEQMEDDIKFLKAVTEGKNYVAEVDSTEAFAKTIKSNVIPEANKASVDSFGGKSVVRNQLFNGLTTSSSYDVTVSFSSETKKVKIRNDNRTTNFSSGASYSIILSNEQLIEGHKYYVYSDYNGGNPSSDIIFTGKLHDQRINTIINANSSTNNASLRITNTYDFVSVHPIGDETELSLYIVDLTQMFGSSIADAITVDSPLMKMLKKFLDDNPSYYSTGEIVSAEVQKIVSAEIVPNIGLWATGKTESWKPCITSNEHPVLPFTLAVSGTSSYTSVPVYVAQVKPSTVYTLWTDTDAFVACAQYKNESEAADASLALETLGASAISPITFTTRASCNCVVISLSAYGKTSPITLTADSVVKLNEGSAPVPHFDPIELPIPAEVKALEGYGWSAGNVYNEVDFARKKFIKRVGREDISGRTPAQVAVLSEHVDAGYAIEGKAYGFKNVLVAGFNTINKAPTEKIDDVCGRNNNNYVTFGLPLDCANDMEKAKSYILSKAQYIYYELATPIETDISDLLTDFNNAIEIESGGTVTFEQQDGGLDLPIPNTISYLRKVVS